jgi:hypothetical protein
MTDMTSKEIHEAIDRSMKRIAARFNERFAEVPASRKSEIAEEPLPYQAD